MFTILCFIYVCACSRWIRSWTLAGIPRLRRREPDVVVRRHVPELPVVEEVVVRQVLEDPVIGEDEAGEEAGEGGYGEG